MDINTPHNSTSFNNESLEESDKSPIKKSNSNVTKRLLHYKPNINLRDGLLHLLHVVHKNLYLIMNQICINKFYTIGVKIVSKGSVEFIKLKRKRGRKKYKVSYVSIFFATINPIFQLIAHLANNLIQEFFEKGNRVECTDCT
ncbi:hypothetical protein RhiirB3_425416 [Rhizophagus irregularis]|nr:hypothetical protein RhiirB3_425416 [Rhizophagus irregularis]